MEQWTYLETAPDQTTAEMWLEVLRDEGIDATLAPEDVSSFLGISMRPCRILVPEADADRARRLLASLGPDSEVDSEPDPELAPDRTPDDQP